MDLASESLNLNLSCRPELSRETRSGHGIRPVDHAVLDMLRREPGLEVPQLMERLEVTATAVRQRLDRLVLLKMIERQKHTIGRGRPSFKYFLTASGYREVGATYADLALALWQEIANIPDSESKQLLLKNVAHRMGKVYGSQIPSGTLREKLEILIRLLGERRIPAKLDDVLPVLEVQACPYPDITDSDDKRGLCELEKQMLSDALGQPMELSRCRLDGHVCCQFRPTSELVSSPS